MQRNHALSIWWLSLALGLNACEFQEPGLKGEAEEAVVEEDGLDGEAADEDAADNGDELDAERDLENLDRPSAAYCIPQTWVTCGPPYSPDPPGPGPCFFENCQQHILDSSCVNHSSGFVRYYCTAG